MVYSGIAVMDGDAFGKRVYASGAEARSTNTRRLRPGKRRIGGGRVDGCLVQAQP